MTEINPGEHLWLFDTLMLDGFSLLPFCLNTRLKPSCSHNNRLFVTLLSAN